MLQGAQVHHLQTFSMCQHWKKTPQAKLILKGICHIHEVAHNPTFSTSLELAMSCCALNHSGENRLS